MCSFLPSFNKDTSRGSWGGTQQVAGSQVQEEGAVVKLVPSWECARQADPEEEEEGGGWGARGGTGAQEQGAVCE